ncbi:sigma-70 family RNA polymerase sigma factor [Luteimicrobium subarcticum]|uniref:RNA polymerase ECF family sigma subunit n=1 Tax=Luteimicrobium subarcticum TaxID=620910 RepID=A0A2M8WS95_9MICO|nr:sigma-70 family RNA polymerase sigma factor [Luteimicrobium subarcticum]PJI93811.1 RNA polymerase ECF family sigma subunit [Luteimicrobium subarcticum]
MDDQVTARFEQERGRLRGVAYRVLGSTHEADDAVQEAWFRLERTDADSIDNLSAWLTTVVSRVCLDMLRARAARREDPWEHDDGTARAEDETTSPTFSAPVPALPEDLAVESDAVGSALLLVLDALGPVERLTFVLHDVFGVPFEEIAPVVGRTPAATRQIASRARRRVRGGGEPVPDRARQRAVVEAFLSASREGRFDDLLDLLDPDAVLRVDAVGVETAAANAAKGAPVLSAEMHGALAVATTFNGRARVARLALVDGEPAGVWAPGGTARSVFGIVVRDGKVVEVSIHMDPDDVAAMDVVLL